MQITTIYNSDKLTGIPSKFRPDLNYHTRNGKSNRYRGSITRGGYPVLSNVAKRYNPKQLILN